MESILLARANMIDYTVDGEGNPFRFAEKGYTEGDDVYVAFGQTFGGRYLSVFFVYKPDTHIAIIISARDMSKKERKAYGRK